MAALSTAELDEQPGAAQQAAEFSSPDNVRSEALSGLMNLGYQRSAAEKAIDSALSEGGDISVESVLKRSLRKLGSRLIG